MFKCNKAIDQFLVISQAEIKWLKLKTLQILITGEFRMFSIKQPRFTPTRFLIKIVYRVLTVLTLKSLWFSSLELHDNLEIRQIIEYYT